MREIMAAEYESEDKFLHVLFNAVSSALSERESHAVGIDLAGYVHAYGPFYDIRSARKAAETYASRLNVRAFITPLHAPSRLEPSE